MTVSPETDVVIGSGPAGLSAALALLARGRQVTMIDAGRRLEPEAEARRLRLAETAPEEWQPADIRALSETAELSDSGIVPRYGSAFAMRTADAVVVDPPGWFGLRSSHAFGGLSNVWGAAVLPWMASDMDGWPISRAELEPHYVAVADFMPIAGHSDRLEREFQKTYLTPDCALPATRQSGELHRRLDAAAPFLDRLGLVAGASRQAVAAGCRACGLCLYGCPWQLIFSAAPLVEQLSAEGRIGYQSGREVTGFNEDGTGVTVLFEGGETLRASRVFVAAGVLESARLLLRSLPALAGAELTLSDSSHAFTPFLHLWRAGDPGAGPHHTLGQAFVELSHPTVSPHLVHTQLYGWNDFYARDMRERYGRLLPFGAPLFERLARRLIVAQTFLHSDHGPKIAISLALGDEQNRLSVRLIANPDTRRVAVAARRRIARGLRHVGLVALAPAWRVGPPGSSFHCGGSLPMSVRPGSHKSDLLGRPAGSDRIHVVDASVLPAVPASTITFPVMANAHRIASLA